MRRVLNIHGINDVRLDPVDPPRPGSKDVVVKVKACGICGSDLTYIKIGGIMRPPGGTTPIGHEAAGEVIAVGDAVSGVVRGSESSSTDDDASYIGSGGPEGAFTEGTGPRRAWATACCRSRTICPRIAARRPGRSRSRCTASIARRSRATRWSCSDAVRSAGHGAVAGGPAA
jgi:hypothetical protein